MYVICCKCKKLLGKLQPFRIKKLFQDKIGEQKLYVLNNVINQRASRYHRITF